MWIAIITVILIVIGVGIGLMPKKAPQLVVWAILISLAVWLFLSAVNWLIGVSGIPQPVVHTGLSLYVGGLTLFALGGGLLILGMLLFLRLMRFLLDQEDSTIVE